MTKQEKAMFEEMIGMMKAMGKRIEGLESRHKGSCSDIAGMSQTAPKKTTKKATTTPKESAVKGLVFSGKYVKTEGFMNSKVRYAIQMTITERFNGKKLGKGNPVYDKAHKLDKYVQVYEFKTVKDADNFYQSQLKRAS